jgi:predicted transcriptional regulator
MPPKIALRGFKVGNSGTGHVLGELETVVMSIFWQQSELTVTDVESKLRQHRSIAHTTVQTTLDRMHRKGYLTREKQGKAFVYSARYTREEFERGMAQEVLGALLGQYTAPALSAFVDLIGDDEQTLDRLEAMIREKRGTRRIEDEGK